MPHGGLRSIRMHDPAEKGAPVTIDQPSGPNEAGTSAGAGSLPFDTTVASQARMYDYLLGGKDNFAADRAAVDAWIKIDPTMAFAARANRAFLTRVIRYLAGEAGIRQFLDIGAGIPTAGNINEVAQAIAPESRVVYVDYDPVALAHARALLTASDAGVTEYVGADLRDTDTVLLRAREVLDFTRPVAVTLLSVLHAIPDSDDPYALVAKIMAAVPSGSYLAISQTGSDLLAQESLDGLADIVAQMRLQPGFRSRDQVGRFFEGTDLVEPGLVPVEAWRPDPSADNAGRSILWCAVGRKP
jgi:S-adenosyl methyltransferase